MGAQLETSRSVREKQGVASAGAGNHAGIVRVACDHNIDQNARNRRMRGGVLVFGVGLAAAVFVVRSGLPTPLRAVTFLPFMVGCLMFFQAAYRTCVFRAVRHQRETCYGIEAVADPEQVHVDVERARSVLMTSSCIAIAATAMLFFIP
jgi:hypothetical protein